MNQTLAPLDLTACDTLYEGPIRDGKPGTRTEASHRVLRDPASGLAFLHPFPQIEYESGAYRNRVNDSDLIEDYLRIHDPQQRHYLPHILPRLARGATVADCGCGGGSLLDALAGIAGTTLAIEPFSGFHDSLRSRGHEVYGSVDQALAQGSGRVDLALSVHVIEHVEDPVSYLAEIRHLLKPGGTLLILTPNLDDLLFTLDPDRFAPFWFRMVHNFYFDRRGLAHVVEQAGFSDPRPFFLQEFGLENTLGWLRDGHPAGQAVLPGFDSISGHWRAFLEQTGRANHLGMVATVS